MSLGSTIVKTLGWPGLIMLVILIVVIIIITTIIKKKTKKNVKSEFENETEKNEI